MIIYRGLGLETRHVSHARADMDVKMVISGNFGVGRN